MGFKQSLEKTLTKLGHNNSPTFIAIGIATAKGIFRPIFTMSDKKENYETKRYTATRECLTEMIAIPVYYTSGVLSKVIAKKLAVPKNFISKDLYNRHLAGDKSEEVMNAVKHAEELAKANKSKITSCSAFIGVCLSALLVIPGLCSLLIKPIMNSLEKRRNDKKKTVADSDVKQIPVQTKELNTFKGIYNRTSVGMKVGGV